MVYGRVPEGSLSELGWQQLQVIDPPKGAALAGGAPSAIVHCDL